MKWITQVLAMFFLYIGPAFAVASPAWVGDFLRQVVSDASMQETGIDVDKQRAVRWIDSLEGRWSVDDSGQDANQFSLRLRPRSSGEVAAEQVLLQLDTDQARIQTDQYASDQLKQRYRLLIDIDYAIRLQKILAQQIAVAEIETRSYLQLAQTEAFKPLRLQTARLRERRLQQQQKSNQQRLANRLSQVAGPADDLALFRFTEDLSFISADLIRSQLKDIRALTGNEWLGNPAMEIAKLEQQQAAQKLKLEKEKRRLSLNFIELGYQPREGSNRSDEYQLSLGVQLPLGGYHTETARRQLQARYAAFKLQRTRQKVHMDIEQQIDELDILIDEHDIYQQRMIEVDSGLHAKRAQGGTLLLVALKKEGFSLARQRLDNLKEIYRGYINLLGLQGKLTRRPLKNWLEAGQPVL